MFFNTYGVVAIGGSAIPMLRRIITHPTGSQPVNFSLCYRHSRLIRPSGLIRPGWIFRSLELEPILFGYHTLLKTLYYPPSHDNLMLFIIIIIIFYYSILFRASSAVISAALLFTKSHVLAIIHQHQ